MNGAFAAEMAVWVPDDAPAAAAEQALVALDRQGLRMIGTVIAVALLSSLAAMVLSMFGSV